MAAIISGNQLGLSTSSLAVLGQRGSLGTPVQGRSGEGVYLDVANGNVVVQRQDDVLSRPGADLRSLRTYNSQGLVDGDNNDNWRIGLLKSVDSLTGTVNRAGSTVVRTDGDGARTLYTFDDTLRVYRNTDGDGAYDTLKFSASTNTWKFTDGASRADETYDGATGRINAASDPNGNTLTYGYDPLTGRLASVDDEAGERLLLTWSGNNLQSIGTVDIATGATTGTRTRYHYDALDRLDQVVVDLSPEDSNTADGAVYVMTYAYDGTSTRIASIRETDGTSMQFTYVQVDGAYRVETVTDGLGRLMRFSYDTAARRTTVEDPLHALTVFEYDAAGQLVKVASPTVDGVAIERRFEYEADGDVSRVIDGEGRATVMAYDANGNMLSQRDSAGNTIERTFDTRFNVVLTETIYASPDPDGAGPLAPSQPLTTRNAYDTRGRLAYSVSPEGRVTRILYRGTGEVTSRIEYTQARFDTSALARGAAPTLADMDAWLAGVDLSKSARTDYTYDFRGNLQAATTFGSVGADGVGIVDASRSVTRYTYDAAGQLLVETSPNSTTQTTVFTYDGLFRVRSAKDAAGNVTVTTYEDALDQTLVTLANNLATTSFYNAGGELFKVAQTDGLTGAALGETRYFYDADGRLRMTRDADGVDRHELYDDAGRNVASVDADGSLLERIFDRSGRVVRTIAHANAVNLSLLEQAGVPTAATLASIRPQPSGDDRIVTSIYDAAGRLAQTIDEKGFVTDTVYDGASRVAGTTGHAAALASFDPRGPIPSSPVAPRVDADDRHTRFFHDADGLLLGELDAEGFLVEHQYDAAGQLVTTIAYAAAAGVSLRASADLAALRQDIAQQNRSGEDIYTRNIYDGHGRIVGVVDGEGYLTAYGYDRAGNRTSSTRYAGRVSAAAYTDLQVVIASLSSADNQVTSWKYDELGRVIRQTEPDSTVTRYEYDSVGNLVRTVHGLGEDPRAATVKYDLQGRVIAELGGVGSAQAGINTPVDQIPDATFAAYGTRYEYDAAGLRISSTDAIGHKTLYFYDADGRLTYTVNALGEVQGQEYNALNQLHATVQYGTRVDLTGLAGGRDASVLAGRLAARSDNEKALDSRRTIAYDVTGTVKSRTDALGADTQYGYNAFGEETSRSEKIDANRRLDHTYVRDHRGLVTDTFWEPDTADAIHATTVYDAFGRAISYLDGNRNAHATAYDKLGRTIALTDPSAHSTSTVYDAFGRKVTETDRLLHATSYSYDVAARKVTVTSPEGIQVTTQRNAHGDVVSVVDGRGNETRYEYDRDAHLTKVTDPTNADITYKYDVLGRLTNIYDGEQNRVRIDYDAANREIHHVVDPAGLALTTVTTFDAKGQAFRVRDAEGRVTLYHFDLEGRVTQRIVDPAGLKLETDFEYDSRGLNILVVDPQGVRTRFDYDDFGRRITQVVDDVDGGLKLTRSWTYDSDGNAKTLTDENGKVTHFYYDKRDRLIFTIDPEGAVLRNDYDDEGRLSGTHAFAVRLTAAQVASFDPVQPPAATAADEVSRRVYDHDGRLTDTIDAAGGLVHFDLDGNGNVTRRVAFAHVLADPAAAITSLLLAQLGDTEHDSVTYTRYDAANRARYTVDGTGGVVERRYDRNGDVTDVFSYAKRLVGVPADSLDGVQGQVDALANATADRHERYHYDHARRLDFSVDGTGAVTEQAYDKNGNVVQRIAYAYRIGAGDAPESVRDHKDPLLDRTTRCAYDAANRQALEMDARGDITETIFHDHGPNRVEETVHYIASTTPWDATKHYEDLQLGLTALRVMQDNRTEYRVYDAAGRVAYAVDGMRFVTRTVYDGVGRVKVTIRQDKALAPSLEDMTAAFIEAHSPVVAADRIDQFDYDNAGRLITSTDALGKSESYLYDAFGNKISFTNKNGATWLYAYDGANRLVSETSPVVTTTTVRYQGGQYVATETPTALVTTTEYDGIGRVTARNEFESYAFQGSTDREVVKQRILQIAGENEAIRAKWEDDAHNVHGAAGFHFVYQAGGWVPNGVTGTLPDGSTKPMVEIIALDNEKAWDWPAGYTKSDWDEQGGSLTRGDGDQFTYAAADGRTVTFEFHKSGDLADEVRQVQRIASENDAIRDVWTRQFQHTNSNFNFDYVPASWTTNDSSGAELERLATDFITTFTSPPTRPIAWGTGTLTVVNGVGVFTNYAVHFDGSRDTRRTTYEYDAAGRQIATTLPATAAASSPTINVAYDVFGDAVRNEDAAGNVSCMAYDRAGNLVYDIDALGHVTKYERDAFGDAIATTRYSAALSLSALDATKTAADIDNLIQSDSHFTGDTLQRKLVVSYDALGRAQTVREPDAFVYDTSGTAPRIGSQGKVTINSYDAFGDLVSMTTTRQLLGNPPFAADDVTYFYDKDGRKIAQVDAGGFATKMEYDAAGNLTKKTEFANALSPKPAPQTAFTPPPADAKDRVTRYEYDKLDRKVKETQVAVELPTPEGARYLDVVTEYGYDDVGNLTRTTSKDVTPGVDASTYTAYDALGRVTAVVAPSRTQNAGAPDSVVLTPVTEFKLDAFGNVVERIDYAHSVAPMTGDPDPHGRYQVIAPDRTAADRTSFAFFDSHGDATSTVDATGHVVDMDYDAGGHVKTRHEDAIVQGNPNAIVTTYQYDALGREITATTLGTSPSDNVEKGTEYNAFGEVIRTTVNGQEYEFYDYDAAGRVWRTNAGDGVVKVYLHDVEGAVTAELRSASNNLRAALDESAALGLDANDERIEHTYNALGREVAETRVAPAPQQAAAYLPDFNFGAGDAGFRSLEDAWEGFYAPETNQPWAGGHISRGQGDVLVYRDAANREWTFHLDAGPLAAIDQSDVLRANVGSAYGIRFQGFATAYIPTDFRQYREIEASLATYLDPNNTQFDDPMDWMGGTLTRSGGVATYTYPGEEPYTFTANTTAVRIMNDKPTIRAGWQQEFGLGVMGAGGETVERPFARSKILDDGKLRLEWTSIGNLGDGDVRVIVSYDDTDGNPHVEENLLSGVSGASTLTVAPEARVNDVTHITVLKKDAKGDWQTIVDGDGTPVVMSKSLLTVSRPADPATKIEVLVQGQPVDPTYDFGDRLVYAHLAGPSGYVDYVIQQLGVDGAPPTPISHGTLLLDNPPLQTLPAVNGPDENGIISWDPAQDADTTELIAWRPVLYTPLNYVPFRAIEADTKLYWDHPEEFAEIDNWDMVGGTLLRIDDQSSVYIDNQGNAVYTLRKDEPVLVTAWKSPEVRLAWMRQMGAAGFEFSFDEARTDHMPRLNEIPAFESLLADYDALFTTTGVRSWNGGTLNVTDAMDPDDIGHHPGTATFTYNGVEHDVSRTEGVFKLANEIPVLRESWERTYGIHLADGQDDASAWSAPIDASASHSFDTSALGTGAFEYELLFAHGTSYYAHTAGMAFVSGGNPDVTIGGLQPIEQAPVITTTPGTFPNTATVDVAWSSDTPVVSTFHYRLAGTNAGWIVREMGTGTSFSTDLPNLTENRYEYEIFFSHPGATEPFAEQTGTFSVTPAKPERDVELVSPDMGLGASGDGTGITLSWRFGGTAVLEYIDDSGVHRIPTNTDPEDNFSGFVRPPVPEGTYAYTLYFGADLDPETGALRLGPNAMQMHGTFSWAPGTPDITISDQAPAFDPGFTVDASSQPPRIYWPTPGGPVAQPLFLYRPTGIDAGWSRLQVDASDPAQFSVSLAGLQTGQYDFVAAYADEAGEVFMRSAGSLTYAVGGGAEVLLPDDPFAYQNVLRDFNAAFNAGGPGAAHSWLNGTVIRGIGDAEYYAPQGVYDFHAGEDIQQILSENETIRHGWESEFGVTFTLGPGSLQATTNILHNGRFAIDQLESDTDFFFDLYPEGTTIDWYAGGTLTHLPGDEALYTHADGTTYTFHRGDSIFKIASEDDQIRTGWENDPNYEGMSFFIGPDQWVADDPVKYQQIVDDTARYFRDTTNFPHGSTRPWLGGTLIRGDNGHAYFAAGGVQTLSRSIGPAGIALQDESLRQQMEFMYGFHFFSATPGMVVTDLGGTLFLPGLPPTADATVGFDPLYVHLDASPASVSITANPLEDNGQLYLGTPIIFFGEEMDIPATAMSVSNATAQAIVESFKDDADVETRVVEKSYDRWGNVLTVTDARDSSWITSYTYNAANQVLTETKARSTTQVFYDSQGHEIATRDANGNLTQFDYNEAGELIREKHADEGSVRHDYTIFGEKARDIDTLGNATGFAYDKAGRLLAESHAQEEVDTFNFASTDHTVQEVAGTNYKTQSRIDSYLYDGAGRRIAATNGAGDTTAYTYDARGNILVTMQGYDGTAAITTITTTWDALNRKKTEQTGTGPQMSWTYKPDSGFAFVDMQTDLAGNLTKYEYDGLKHVTSQTRHVGMDGPVLQDLRFAYDAAGRNTGITDTVENSITTYAYDKADNRVYEGFVKEGVTYQDNQLTYDQLGRVTRVVDSRHHMEIQYDAVGNRKVVDTTYTDDAGQLRQVTNSYTYDAMNRVLTEANTKRLNNGSDDGDHTVTNTYDTEGNKTSVTQFGVKYAVDGSGKERGIGDEKTVFEYDHENRLVKSYITPIDGSVVTGATEGSFDRGIPYDFNTTGIRRYDAAGRVAEEITFHLNRSPNDNPGGDDFADKVYSMYDRAGRLSTQLDIDYEGNRRYGIDYSYDTAGNLGSYHLKYRDNDFDDTYTYDYYRDTSYHEKSIELKHEDHRTGNVDDVTSVLTYDANGHLVRFDDKNPDKQRTRLYVNDLAGSVLARADDLPIGTSEGTPLTSDALAAVSAGLRVQHMLVVGEQTVGLQAQEGDDPAIERFDFGAQSSGALGSQPSHYVLSSADAAQGLNALKGIAQAVYGDSTLWYVIAEANGITSENQIKEGLSLIIPTDVASNRNDFRTFKAYDPSVLKGDTNPTLPVPQGHNGGCGVMGTIVIAVIAIAATVFTAGAASLAMSGGLQAIATAGVQGVAEAGAAVFTGGSALGAGEVFVAGAAGGAAGSVAGQAAAIATGAQDKFSLRSVATGAITGGLTAGLANVGGAANLLLGLGGQTSAGIAVNAAVNSALTQGVRIAMGEQKTFNWTAVAANAIAAPIADQVTTGLFQGQELMGPTLDGRPLYAGTALSDALGRTGMAIASGTVYGTLTEAAVRAAGGGHIRWENIAADAFGNALGQGMLNRTRSSAGVMQGSAFAPIEPLQPLEPQREIAQMESFPISSADGDAEAFDHDMEPYGQFDPRATVSVRNTANYATSASPRQSPGLVEASEDGSDTVGYHLGIPIKAIGTTPVVGEARRLHSDLPYLNSNSIPDQASGLRAMVDDGGNRFWAYELNGGTHYAITPPDTLPNVIANFPETFKSGVLNSIETNVDLAAGSNDDWAIRGNAAAGAFVQTFLPGGYGEIALGFGAAPIVSHGVRVLNKVPILGDTLPQLFGRMTGTFPNRSALGRFFPVESGGVRGELPLSPEVRAQVENYLSKFDLNGVQIKWVDNGNLSTAYGDMFGERILHIGTDVVPGNIGVGTFTANSRISINGALAHEIVGHMEAAMARRTQDLIFLEEAQASIRAARFAPGLSSTERVTLLRDAITRLQNAPGGPVRVRDVRDLLYISHR